MVTAGFAYDGGFGSPDSEDSGGTAFPEPPKLGAALRSWPECLAVDGCDNLVPGRFDPGSCVEILCGYPACFCSLSKQWLVKHFNILK